MTQVSFPPIVEETIQAAVFRYTHDSCQHMLYFSIARNAVWNYIVKHEITISEYPTRLSDFFRSVKEAVEEQQTKSPIVDVGVTYDIFQQEHNVIQELTTGVSPEMYPQILDCLKKDSLREKTTFSQQKVIWFLVHMHGITHEQIPKYLTYRFFVKNELGYWLRVFFKNSPSQAIQSLYLNKFTYFDFIAPRGYWKSFDAKDKAAEVLKDALQKTRKPLREYPKIMSYKFLEQHKLDNVMHVLFSGSRFQLLNWAFPRQFHPWEFSYTEKGYFDLHRNRKKAVRWLVEKKLGFPIPSMTVHEIWEQNIAQKITKEVFIEHGLRELMQQFGSPEPLLNRVYPGKFLKWSFASKSKWEGEKGKKLAAEATRWVIEEHFKLSPSSRLTYNFFSKNGLHGMITSKILGFNSSPRKVLQNAYPHL